MDILDAVIYSRLLGGIQELLAKTMAAARYRATRSKPIRGSKPRALAGFTVSTLLHPEGRP